VPRSDCVNGAHKWLLNGIPNTGTVVIYCLLFHGWDPKTAKKDLRRAAFLKFEEKLTHNRTIAEMEEEKADFKLLEYDRLNQTPNDESAIKYRLAVLTEYLRTAIKVKT
jgi:hypothetical protein